MKINWKGNLIALGIIGSVAGAYVTVHYNDFTTSNDIGYVAAKADTDVTADNSQDNTIANDKSNDITVAPYDGTDKITIVDDNSPFVDTSYMQDKPKQEIKVGSPFQDVLKVLGQPDDKVVTKGKYGSSELWSYGNESIFFVDGFVDSITEVK